MLMVFDESSPAAAPAAHPRTYRNPILFADYSDPDVIRVGQCYYMVASTFHFSPGIPVLKSMDLVHWTIIAHALPRLVFHKRYDLPGPISFDDSTARPPWKPTDGQGYSGGVWAPAIRYHQGCYYIYFATPSDGIFMVSATNAEGPWNPPVTLAAEAGFEDPCPFWDDDGKAYLVHSRVGAGPLILHKMSSDGKTLLDKGTVIVQEPEKLPTLEGPKLIKRHGYYYIFAPYGGVGEGPQAVLRSKNIYGPYEWRTVLEKGNTKIQAPHQGGYVETASGEGWFVHFNQTGAYGRIVYLEPVRWNGDWPLIGEPISETSGQPVASYPMPDSGRSCTPDWQPQTSDDFTDNKLGVQWEWNHNPVDSAWSLTERRGYLRLRALPAKNFLSARNTLTQVHQGSASEWTVKIDFDGMVDGQRAGLGLLKARPSWIGVAQTAGSRRLTFAAAGVETAGPLVKKNSALLRMAIENDTARYFYSVDSGATFIPLGNQTHFRFSWWKGIRPALFSYSIADGSVPRGLADFDWVKIRQLAPKPD